MLRFLIGLLLISLGVLIIQQVVIDTQRGERIVLTGKIQAVNRPIIMAKTVHPINYPTAAVGGLVTLAGLGLTIHSLIPRRTGDGRVTVSRPSAA